MSERFHQIDSLRRDGLTWAAIGRKLLLTPYRVRQIWQRELEDLMIEEVVGVLADCDLKQTPPRGWLSGRIVRAKLPGSSGVVFNLEMTIRCREHEAATFLYKEIAMLVDHLELLTHDTGKYASESFR